MREMRNFIFKRYRIEPEGFYIVRIRNIEIEDSKDNVVDAVEFRIIDKWGDSDERG